jgi:hypothetical protein
MRAGLLRAAFLLLTLAVIIATIWGAWVLGGMPSGL